MDIRNKGIFEGWYMAESDWITSSLHQADHEAVMTTQFSFS